MSVGGKLTVELSAARTGTNSDVSNLNPGYDTALTFTYDQSLIRNFGYDVNTTGVRIAQRDLTISREAFRQIVIDTLLATEKAYWDLKFAWEDLLVKKTPQSLSEETLKQNKIRVEVGTMAPIDVTTAEAEVAQRQVAVLQAENTLENAQDMLRLYLNQPETAPVWVLDINAADEPPFDEDLVIELETAIQEAVSRRPDLAQIRLGMENDADSVKYARNQLRYDLGLRAQYGKTGLAGTFFNTLVQPPVQVGDPTGLSDALQDLYQEDWDNWLIGLNFIIPFNNKAAKANYLNARLGQDQRAGAYDSLLLDSAIEVRNRVRAVENAIQRVKAGRVNVRLQRERLAAENKRYENGMTTTFDLFRFQDELAQAASQVILAQVDYNKALVDLDAAKGTLAEDRGVQEADLLAAEPAKPDLP
jgi:outer membrane protein TolC